MNRVFLIYLSGLLLLVSCNNKKNANDFAFLTPSEIFSKQNKLIGEVLDNAYYGKVESVWRATDHGILVVQQLDREVIQLLSYDNGLPMVRTGGLGRGPDEFIFPFIQSYDNISSTLYIENLVLRTIYAYSISENSIIKQNNFKMDYSKNSENELNVLNGFGQVTDSTFIFLNRTPSEAKIIDLKGNLYFSMPIKTIDREEMDYSSNKYFQMNLLISPDRSTVGIIDTDLHHIAVYKLENNRLIPHSKRQWLEWDISYTNGWYVANKDHYYFTSPRRMTDIYIYSVVQDRTMKNAWNEKRFQVQRDTYLLVFDFDCNLVAQYYMDIPFHTYVVTNDNKYLYALNHHEMEIIRYELPKIKK